MTDQAPGDDERDIASSPGPAWRVVTIRCHSRFHRHIARVNSRNYTCLFHSIDRRFMAFGNSPATGVPVGACCVRVGPCPHMPPRGTGTRSAPTGLRRANCRPARWDMLALAACVSACVSSRAKHGGTLSGSSALVGIGRLVPGASRPLRTRQPRPTPHVGNRRLVLGRLPRGSARVGTRPPSPPRESARDSRTSARSTKCL
jgi:hypothetical protein